MYREGVGMGGGGTFFVASEKRAMTNNKST